MSRPLDALEAFDKSLSICPGCFPALQCKATVLNKLERYEEIKEIGRLVKELDAIQPNDKVGLAFICSCLLYTEETIGIYQSNLAKDPKHWQSHFGLGMELLLQGNLSDGFKKYEGRLLHMHWQSCPLIPRWEGEPIEGKTLLIYGEQGVGDIIQFARYIPFLSAYKCKLLFQVQSNLQKIFTRLNCLLLPTGIPTPVCDLRVSVNSFPFIFKTDLSNIPPPVPLRCNLRPIPNRIGIVWKGNPGHIFDTNRSIPLSTFFLPVPGVQYVSLQKEVTPEEAALLDANGVERPRLNDWQDTLHVLETCERVICVDTAVAHLAASMGIPTWILIPRFPDWRWMLNRTDSPWYPSVRLFRQIQFGRWAEPLEEIQNRLCSKTL